MDGGDDVGKYGALALDAAGHPRIAYLDNARDNLRFAAWNGASWTIEEVDTAGSVGAWCGLTLDAAGNPHISYRDWGQEGFRMTQAQAVSARARGSMREGDDRRAAPRSAPLTGSG